MSKNINRTNGKKLDSTKKTTKSRVKPKQKIEIRNLLHKLETAKKAPKAARPEVRKLALLQNYRRFIKI